jgi:hypothetical protein
MGSTGRPSLIHCAISDMTGTEPHAPRGTAGRGPNWARGPCELGPWAVRVGPRRSCTALYEAAPPAVGSTGTMGRALAE